MLIRMMSCARPIRTSPFIPEGVGPCQASSLGKFVDFLWVSRTGERHTPARGRGQGSTVGRPVGLGLDAGSERRRIFVPGNPGVVGGRVLQRPDADG